ncbi:uncharacterized protein LOC143910632 [Arctopsyche grandis]|uniref:uncharacterized protein LOC143910632 n=1 Tax=Arctopsyche grandis TaxID=121162 RepID=UPI00406D868D
MRCLGLTSPPMLMGRPPHIGSPETMSASPEKHTSEDLSTSSSISPGSPSISRESFHHMSPPHMTTSGQKNYEDKTVGSQTRPEIQTGSLSNFSLSGILAKPNTSDSCTTPTDLSMMVSKGYPCPSSDYQNHRSQDNSEDDSDTEIDLTSHNVKDDIRQSVNHHYMNGNNGEVGPVLNEMVPNDLSMHCGKNNLH